MVFAIEEINNSSFLLPNVSLGYKIFDSCASALPTTRAGMGLMNGEKRTSEKNCSGQSSIHAVVGTSESSTTIVMLQISGIFQIPVVNANTYLASVGLNSRKSIINLSNKLDCGNTYFTRSAGLTNSCNNIPSKKASLNMLMFLCHSLFL